MTSTEAPTYTERPPPPIEPAVTDPGKDQRPLDDFVADVVGKGGHAALDWLLARLKGGTHVVVRLLLGLGVTAVVSVTVVMAEGSVAFVLALVALGFGAAGVTWAFLWVLDHDWTRALDNLDRLHGRSSTPQPVAHPGRADGARR